MVNFISTAYADSIAAGTGSSINTGFEWLFLIGFFIIFYFIIWRPQAKRAREHKKLINNLKQGDEVFTSGGIVGKISNIKNEFVIVEVSESIELTFQKTSIITVLPKGTIKAI